MLKRLYVLLNDFILANILNYKTFCHLILGQRGTVMLKFKIALSLDIGLSFDTRETNKLSHHLTHIAYTGCTTQIQEVVGGVISNSKCVWEKNSDLHAAVYKCSAPCTRK